FPEGWATAAVGANQTYTTDQNGQCIISGVDLSRLLNYTAQLGPTLYSASVPTGTTTANLPLPPYGNIAIDAGAGDTVITAPGSKITLYDEVGNFLFEYDPTKAGNLVGGNFVLRGLPPGIVVTAVFTAPSGASVPLNPNTPLTVSTSPAVSDANVTVVDEATTSQIAVANVAKGGVNARVFYSDGTTPLAGVTATLAPRAAGGTSVDANTGPNGVATFPVADIGTYDLTFTGASITAAVVTLTAAQPVQKLDFTSTTPVPSTLGKITITSITYGDSSQLNNGANVILTGPPGAGFAKRSAGYYAGRPIVFDRVPYGTYTLKAAPNQGDDGAEVATSTALTLASGSPVISATGTLATTKPTLGSVTVTYTANGVAVAPGTLVAATQSLDASVSASPLGNTNVKVFKNLTPGTWYFAMGTSTAGGAAIKGIYAQALTVDGTAQTLTVDGAYKIATVAAGAPPVANLTVNISPSLNDTVLTGANGIATVALWTQSPNIPKLSGDYNLQIRNGGYLGEKTMVNAETSALIPLTSGNAATVYGEIFDARTKEKLVGEALISLNQQGGVSGQIVANYGEYNSPVSSAGVWNASISAQGYS
ncbi:MAG: hypothetical protein WCJ49_07930, partial [Deltaproteobacteria bacterium]